MPVGQPDDFRVPIASSSLEEYAECGLVGVGPVVLLELLHTLGIAGRELGIKQLRACLAG